METQMRGNLSMSEEQYLEIIALKTAALTDCACRLGALASNADDEVERLGRYGHAIGMAFQIVDDVFDIASTQGRIGKPVGNDIREGDITLPMLRAMQSQRSRAPIAGGHWSNAADRRRCGAGFGHHSRLRRRGILAGQSERLYYFGQRAIRSI